VRNVDRGAERHALLGDCESQSADQDVPPADEGHPRMVADLARNYHEALVRFLMLRVGSKDEAREIAQEAYAKLLALDRPGSVSFLAGYLWRTAANLAIDRRRQRTVRERFADIEAQGEEKLAPSAERVAEGRQRLAIVERAIGELPPRCLEAFNLRVLCGMRFEDVGREMRVSERMAQIYVARALEYLQSCLDAADASGSRR
jgi:RNA polymerase sigma-70 factor (ECF subfamily)